MAATVLLCSDGLAALGALVEERRARRAVLLRDAADPLDDGDALVERDVRRLSALGLEVRVVRVGDLADGLGADVLVVGGGDPFHLLGALRASGADETVVDAVEQGLSYVGLSAGALVAGPDLAPAAMASPFTPGAGQPLRGLGLAPVVALPHHERPGRADAHRAALAAYGARLRLVPLADEDAVVVTAAGSLVVHGPQRGVRLRSALPGDAPAIAHVILAASRAAWGPFLGDAVVASVEPPVRDWSERLRALPARDAVLVATVDGVVASFAHADTAAGVLETFYTEPSRWGQGIGRALLSLAEDVLRGSSCRRAVLWTEERNERARRVYEAAGWEADGGVQEREWHGARLRELRYRKAL